MQNGRSTPKKAHFPSSGIWTKQPRSMEHPAKAKPLPRDTTTRTKQALQKNYSTKNSLEKYGIQTSLRAQLPIAQRWRFPTFPILFSPQQILVESIHPISEKWQSMKRPINNSVEIPDPTHTTVDTSTKPKQKLTPY